MPFPTSIDQLPHISHGFYQVTHAHAKALAGGKLPGECREKQVEFDGCTGWLSQTPIGFPAKMVWAISRLKSIPKDGESEDKLHLARVAEHFRKYPYRPSSSYFPTDIK